MAGRLGWRSMAAFALLASSQALGAQARLVGTVRDSAGAALPGVEISIAGVTRAAMCFPVTEPHTFNFTQFGTRIGWR